MSWIDPVEYVGVFQQKNGNVLNVKPPAFTGGGDCQCNSGKKQKG